MRSAIPIGGLVVPKLQSKLYHCLDWLVELTYKTKLAEGQRRPLVGRASGPCCAKLAAPQALLL